MKLLEGGGGGGVCKFLRGIYSSSKICTPCDTKDVRICWQAS